MTGRTQLLKQPLLHFLLLGLGLFILFELTGEQEPDSRRIIVDRDMVMNYVQYQAQAFDPEAAGQHLDNLDPESYRQLVREVIREEALYREALSLEMEREDYVIKKRLIQKVEFLSEGFLEEEQAPGEEELRDYYANHSGAYAVPPTYTFTHVFYSGTDQESTRLKLDELNKAEIPFHQATAHGEAFPYFRNYVERPPDIIRGHFGEGFLEEIQSLEPDDKLWRGPFQSNLGYHLVMLVRADEERVPEFEQIRERIARDLILQREEERNDEAIGRIIDQYEVEVVYRPEVLAGDPDDGSGQGK